MPRFCHWSLKPFVVLLLCAAWLPLVGGCDNDERKFLSMGTAPVGGAFPQVGADICEVLNLFRGDNNWKAQARGTKGSQENIRRLVRDDLQLALSNAAITYFAVRGTGGWEQAYDVKSLVTIAPNVAMFITKQETGIRSMADLKGKRVVCGPAGAGFDMFVGLILEEHGLSFDDFTKLNNTQSGAVDMLADGNADAAFLGGAIPTGAIQQACSSFNIHFVPFDDDARQRLVKKYPFFHPVTIPADTYSDMPEAYQGLNVGSMHLIVAGDLGEEIAYNLTKTIWEHRQEIAHPAAKKFINEQNAPRYTGTDFHPGAIRFYREIGIWPEDRPAQSGAGIPPQKTDASNNR